MPSVRNSSLGISPAAESNFTENTTQTLYSSTDALQVNIAADSGDMGILANHVPSIEPLKAGIIEIIESSGTKRWFGACTCILA